MFVLFMTLKNLNVPRNQHIYTFNWLVCSACECVFYIHFSASESLTGDDITGACCLELFDGTSVACCAAKAETAIVD